MAYPTTYNTETELSSVNAILAAIGQAPVSRLYTKEENTYDVPWSKDEQKVRHD